MTSFINYSQLWFGYSCKTGDIIQRGYNDRFYQHQQIFHPIINSRRIIETAKENTIKNQFLIHYFNVLTADTAQMFQHFVR